MLQQEPKNLNNARKSFEQTLRFEVGADQKGGYTKDPKDPGGETKYGISKRAHPELDIENLTPEQALRIYLNDYWFPSGADDLPYPACLIVFDTAFLCGVGRAKAWLRQTSDPYAYLELRKQFHLQKARDHEWAKRFIGGWLNRIGVLKRELDLNLNNK